MNEWMNEKIINTFLLELNWVNKQSIINHQSIKLANKQSIIYPKINRSINQSINQLIFKLID